MMLPVNTLVKLEVGHQIGRIVGYYQTTVVGKQRNMTIGYVVDLEEGFWSEDHVNYVSFLLVAADGCVKWKRPDCDA